MLFELRPFADKLKEKLSCCCQWWCSLSLYLGLFGSTTFWMRSTNPLFWVRSKCPCVTFESEQLLWKFELGLGLDKWRPLVSTSQNTVLRFYISIQILMDTVGSHAHIFFLHSTVKPCTNSHDHVCFLCLCIISQGGDPYSLLIPMLILLKASPQPLIGATCWEETISILSQRERMA